MRLGIGLSLTKLPKHTVGGNCSQITTLLARNGVCSGSSCGGLPRRARAGSPQFFWGFLQFPLYLLCFTLCCCGVPSNYNHRIERVRAAACAWGMVAKSLPCRLCAHAPARMF